MTFVADMMVHSLVHRLILESFGADFSCVCKTCSKARGQREQLKTMEESDLITMIENPEDSASHLMGHHEPLRTTNDTAASDMERACATCTYFMRCLKDGTKTQEYLSSLVETISILLLDLMQQRIKNGDLSIRINDHEEPRDATSPPTDQHTHRRVIPKPVDITLDVDTACNFLHLSDDWKTASWSFTNKNHPESPQRFTYRPQVLSSQSFSEGFHYWDVEVSRSDEWRVGMCYPSMDRKGGSASVIGNNEKSWCLARSHNRYYVMHSHKKTPVSGSGDYVRISLDYNSGVISFHDLGFPNRLLYRFTATFTEPLHAVLGVWKGCIKIPGGTSGGGENFNEMGVRWNINPTGWRLL